MAEYSIAPSTQQGDGTVGLSSKGHLCIPGCPIMGRTNSYEVEGFAMTQSPLPVTGSFVELSSNQVSKPRHFQRGNSRGRSPFIKAFLEMLVCLQRLSTSLFSLALFLDVVSISLRSVGGHSRCIAAKFSRNQMVNRNRSLRCPNVIRLNSKVLSSWRRYSIPMLPMLYRGRHLSPTPHQMV
jgi:hypothetical protein